MESSLLKKDWNEVRSFFGGETRKHSLLRYITLLLFIVAYFVYESRKLGAGNGFLVTVLTWSFFVFCTPIADAGFILAFPVRLLAGIRMLYTQLASYVVALVIVILTLLYSPGIYGATLILRLFNKILLNPFPYWIILVLSLAGTLFSIYFGDELMDVARHRDRKKYHKHLNKYKIIVTLFIIAATITIYYFLLNEMGIKIPLG